LVPAARTLFYGSIRFHHAKPCVNHPALAAPEQFEYLGFKSTARNIDIIFSANKWSEYLGPETLL
jgi:hypothetical protein